MDFEPLGLATDLVILTVRDGGLRGAADPPRHRAVPGSLGAAGRLRPPRRGPRGRPPAANSPRRPASASDRIHLEQIATYGAPGRDPRGRVVSVAYLALVPDLPAPVAGTDAASASWVAAAEVLDDPARLAFDHHQILTDAVERARAKLEYSPLAAAFCPDEFTISELRSIYEAVWGIPLDPRNFHRKVTKTPGFVDPVGTTTTRDGGRPAQLFRRGTATTLHPPMTRA